MLATTLSSKGQVVLPKSVRDAKRWQPGTRLVAVETPDGVLLKAETPAKTRTVNAQELAGLLKHKGPPIPESEWGAGIAKAVRKQWTAKK